MTNVRLKTLTAGAALLTGLVTATLPGQAQSELVIRRGPRDWSHGRVVASDFVPGRGAEFNARTAESTPLKRVGQPDDVAAAIQALATTMRFVTGTRIVIDGGRHL